MGLTLEDLTIQEQRGVSIVEVLIAILIVVVASIGTLSYFASGLGGVGKQSNRRAAMERARERLEQLMATDVNAIKPVDNNPRWVKCTGSPCSWSSSTSAPSPAAIEKIPVEDIGLQPIETTVQCVHDEAAGTPIGTCDTLELGAKVWFLGSYPADNNDFHRVYLKTLRTP